MWRVQVAYGCVDKERAMVKRWLGKLGAGPWGPIRLALVLAVPTLPIVTWAIASPTLAGSYAGTGIALADALPIAVGAVVAASLAGGFVGGRLARRQDLSVFAALAVAWFTGMLSLSVVPWLLGINYVGAVFCIDGCQALMTAANPMSGGIAWAAGVGTSTITIAPPLIAVALLNYSRRFERRGNRVAAASLIAAAQAVAQWVAFAGGGVPAIAVYLCLGVGVVIWATVIVPVPVLQEHDPRDGLAVLTARPTMGSVRLVAEDDAAYYSTGEDWSVESRSG